MGEAPPTTSDFQHQEKIDLYECSIEFKEVDIVEANNSGTSNVDGVNQDLKEEVNIVQGKNDDEAFEQMSSIIQVEEKEATTIQTNQESDYSTIFLDKSKCDEPYAEEHIDNENVDDAYTEKKEHNICFDHEDQKKDHDPLNQATNVESDIIQLQSEVKIDDETVLKDSFTVDEDDKEEVANESLQNDGFCGEILNKEMGEEHPTTSDFQHQEQLDLHECSIEFKEVDIIEANNSGTSTVEGVNQDLNEEVNIIQGKNDDEAFEQMSSIIKVEEKEATTIQTNQESDCSMIFLDKSKCDEHHAEEHIDNENVDDANTDKEEHNTCFEYEDQKKVHDPLNQATNDESDIIQLQREVKIDDETIFKDSFKLDEDDKVEVANERLKKDGFCGENLNKEMGEAPTIASDFQHQEKIDLHESSIEFKEVDIVEANNSGTSTLDGVSQDLNEELNIIQGKKDDEAFAQMSSIIEVKEKEATTIQTNQESDCSTIFVDKSKCDESHAEAHIDNENVDVSYTEKEEHNTCFEHEDVKKDNDPSNQATNVEPDIIQLQTEVKTDDDTILKDSFKVDEDDKEEVGNESLKKDGFCGENLNKEMGEAPSTTSDFQHKEKIDLNVSSIEFKEVDTVEANHSGTSTVDGVNQDLNEEVNIIQGKNDDEAFEQMSSIIEVKEKEATTIQTNQESDCSTIFVDKRKCIEPYAEELIDNENVDDAYTEKEEHNTCFDYEDQKKDHDPLNQASNVESDIFQLQREVKIVNETILKDSFKVDEDDKEEVANKSLNMDGFCGENRNKEIGEAPMIASDFQHQEKIDLHKSSIEFKEVDIVEANNSGTATVDGVNQATSVESDIIQLQREVKIDDETILKDSFSIDEDDEKEVANESLNLDGFCGENQNREIGEAPTIAFDFQHQEKQDLHESSIELKEVDIVEANNSGTSIVDGVNKDLNKEINIIPGKNDGEEFEQMSSSIEVKENKATTIQSNQESDCSMIFVEQRKCDEPHAEEHIDNENVDDLYTKKEEHNTCFAHEDQKKYHDPSNQATNIESDIIQLQRKVKIDDETILKYSFKVDEDDKEEVANESLKMDGICGENLNKEIGEAPTTTSDFQHQEKIDLHESSIEFKEVDIDEANNSGTSLIDGVNQDLNEKVNIIQGKNNNEAFEQMSFIIEVKENGIVDDTYMEKAEHNTCFEHEDHKKDQDRSNQVTNVESDIFQLQREVKIVDETILKDSFKVDEDDKKEVANESLKKDGFYGENLNKEMGEAPTIASDFQHQELIDLHESSIEFKEVDIVEANFSGTSTVDGVNQDLNEDENIIQGKNDDEAMSSIIEVKEKEATTIQTNQESDCSTIFVDQRKCDEPHVEEHIYNENVDDTYTEKVELNTCFEHEDQKKDHDPSNQATSVKSDIIQLQREVKIDDETILKDSFKFDKDDKEEVANESLNMDGFCGENLNKEMGEAPIIASDFQHQEKIDLQESSIEFKEGDIVDANNSGTTNVDGVNQDLNKEVNIIHGKNDYEAFEQMNSIIEVKETKATTIQTNQESDCSTIFVDRIKCDEPQAEEHRDNKNVDDTYKEKEEHNTCFEHEDQKKDQDQSNQATSVESDVIQLEREEKIDDENILKDSFKVDKDDKEEVGNESLNMDGFCVENLNRKMGEAPTIASDFQHQEKIDLYESSIEFKEVDIVEANNSGTTTVYGVNQDLNKEVNIILGKNDDEAFEQMSSIIEVKENKATTIQSNQEGDCSTIFVEHSKCDERHAEEHRDNKNVDDTYTTKEEHNTCFEHEDQEKDQYPSNQIIITDNKQDISKAKEVKDATKDNQVNVIDPKASDEEEIEASNERDFDSGMSMSRVRDIDPKTTHKKSLNILSGVGSKVKHSISKVKKAMTCTSAPFVPQGVIIKLNKNKK